MKKINFKQLKNIVEQDFIVTPLLISLIIYIIGTILYYIINFFK
jgi:hypothetical protein